MDYKEMLHDIDVLDFAIVDISEYMDTHVGDMEAMGYCKHFCNMKKQIVKEFEKECYPLLMDCQNDYHCWEWTKQPLPWEGVC